MDSDNSSVTVKTQPYVIFCSEAFYDCDNSTGTIKTRTVYRARSICKKAAGFFQVQYLSFFSLSLSFSFLRPSINALVHVFVKISGMIIMLGISLMIRDPHMGDLRERVIEVLLCPTHVWQVA